MNQLVYNEVIKSYDLHTNNKLKGVKMFFNKVSVIDSK